MDDLSATYALLDALELSESEPGMSESELVRIPHFIGPYTTLASFKRA